MRELSAAKEMEDYSVVWALNQTRGRGQMGTVWNSQPGKNLTISVYKEVSWLGISNHFFISIAVSLALIQTLSELMIINLKIKWPNDILSDNKKLGGILIENIIKNNQLKASIIGIGLNVNQTNFNNLPQASSLINITGRVIQLEEILDRVMVNIKASFLKLQEKHAFEELKKNYNNTLFRLNKPSTFKDKNNNLFAGYIYGTDKQGNLLVLLENKVIKSFGFKEITLLY
jgi:BirA family biotin operon repressor/biotin-[acetyl-CoA-carboxylase] ligase